MSTQKKFLPVLYPLNKEIGKTWFVQYTAKDGLKKKIYGRLNHLPEIADRIAEADRIINGILATDQLQPAHTISNQLMRDLEEVFNLLRRGWCEKTERTYRTHFYSFALWYRAAGCPPMDIRQAENFLNSLIDRGCSKTTRNNYRNNLKALFRALTKYFKARYQDNAFADVRLLSENRKTKEWFRPSQVLQLKEVINDRDFQLWLAVRFMVHTFVRPNEIRQLRVKHIIWESGKLRIESSIAKTVFVRHIKIPDALLQDLQFLHRFPEHYFIFGKDGYPGSVPYGRDTLSKRHKAILEDLEYPAGFTFYGWKNTGAVKMLCQDKRNLRYISKCMGHHSLDMTDRYFESLGVDDMDDIRFPDI